MRFSVIDAKKAEIPVQIACAALNVSVSGYYAWKNRKASHSPPPRLARVIDIRKMLQQTAKAGFRAEIVHLKGSRIGKPDGIAQHAIVKRSLT